MKYNIKKLTLPLLLSFLLLLIYLGFKPKAINVISQKIELKKLTFLLHEEAKFTAKDRFLLRADQAGLISRCQLHVGDTISPQQPLYQISSLNPTLLNPQNFAALEEDKKINLIHQNQSASQLEIAKLDHQLAVEHWSRLSQKGVVSDLARSEALNQLNSTKLQIKVAEDNLQQLQLQYQKTTILQNPTLQNGQRSSSSIFAPISGQVLKIYRQDEGIVMQGESLLEIADLKKCEIEIELLSEQAISLHPGTPFQLNETGLTIPLHGTLTRIEPKAFTKTSSLGIEEQRVLIFGDLAPESQQALAQNAIGDGYKAIATIQLWELDQTIVAPTSGVFLDQQGWFCFLIHDHHCTKRRLEIGKKNGRELQIIKGVQQGDTIIVYPPDNLRDGDLISTKISN
jgi:HlyD family secretion protein